MIIKIDGGSRNNPGKSACAMVIDDNYSTAIGKYLGIKTNNEAEYYGLLLALVYINKNNINNCTILSDSMLIVNQFNSKWMFHKKELSVLCHKCWDLSNKKIIKLSYIPREQNYLADKKVNEVLDNNK